MYDASPKKIRNTAADIESALMWAHAFIHGAPGVTEDDEPAACAHDCYSLAYFLWHVVEHLASAKLSPAQAAEITKAIRDAEASFLLRFPSLFRRAWVRDAFASAVALINAAATPDGAVSHLKRGRRTGAFAAVAWLRNSLHNVYLEERHMRKPAGRAGADGAEIIGFRC